MKIVIVTIEPPNPFGNAASRWYYVLLNELKRRGYQFEVFSTFSNAADVEKSKKYFPENDWPIKYYPHKKNGGLVDKLKSFLEPYSFKISKEMQTDLEEAVDRGCDVLHLEQIWSGWAAKKYRNKAIVNIHHLQTIDLENASSLDSDFQHFYDKFLITRGEEQIIKRFKYIRCCSQRLVPYIKKINSKSYVETIPVGIDGRLYKYIEDNERSEGPVLVLIGSMNWYPTKTAALRLLNELWPEIKKQVPTCKLQIVGYEARKVLKDYLNIEEIEIFENVPDIEQYFKAGNLLVYAPGRGSGMKIKILEAMLFGLPVVTTAEGVEGIPAIDGLQAGVAETNEEIIQRAVHYLSDIDLQNKMRREARKLVEEHCGPIATVDSMIKFYEKVGGKK